jgi:hypothetical protein
MNWREQRHRQSFSVVFRWWQKFTFPTMGMPSNHPKLDHISIEITIVLGGFGNSRLWSIHFVNDQYSNGVKSCDDFWSVHQVLQVWSITMRCQGWGSAFGERPIMWMVCPVLKKNRHFVDSRFLIRFRNSPRCWRLVGDLPIFVHVLGLSTSSTFPSKVDSRPTLLGHPHLPISRRILNYLQVMSFSICKSLQFVLYNFEIKSYKIHHFFVTKSPSTIFFCD